MLTAEQDVIRNVALWLALALAQPALAQTVPTAAPKPSPANPSPAKPSPAKTSSTKPSPPKPAAKKPEPPKPDAAAEHGPCIGVIPHIGASFAVQSIGLTVFGNGFKDVPIESWGLDDLIVARVRAAAGPRFTVRRIAYPANAFATFDNPPLFHNTENDIKEVVQTVAPASGCERYLVVVKGASQFGNSNQIVRGIGVLNRGGLIDRFNATFLFAFTALYVIDGHTFDILKKGAGSTEDNQLLHDLLTMPALRGPNRELEDFSWPPAPEAVTGLREPTRALLAASLDKVLPGLLAR
jgi:hypothetical protein